MCARQINHNLQKTDLNKSPFTTNCKTLIRLIAGKNMHAYIFCCYSFKCIKLIRQNTVIRKTRDSVHLSTDRNAIIVVIICSDESFNHLMQVCLKTLKSQIVIPVITQFKYP